MAHRSLLPEAVDRYLATVVTPESPIQQRLRAETARLPGAGMQIGADQGVLLAFLIRLIGARNAIEVGTFTGYSALAVAGALPPDGRLVCCDVSDEWTAIARRYWAEAGVAGSHRPAPASCAGNAGGAVAAGARRRRSTSRSSTPTRPATTATTKPASSCSARAG